MAMTHRLAALAVTLTLGACGTMSGMMSGITGSGAAPAKVSSGVLVGPGGMTLYTFDRDAAGGGKSLCNGPCAANWPPLMATTDAAPSGDWAVVTRDDGGKQWAYKGKPVYYWSKDRKPGDRTGDGFSNVWRVAKP
jgi:predicted lipoprotein with Yx(FWY)xxD motif